MSKALIFLGVVIIFVLVGPYFGINIFGDPRSELSKPPSPQIPTKYLELDPMDPVPPDQIESTEYEEESNGQD